jgi:hypothetical protein
MTFGVQASAGQVIATLCARLCYPGKVGSAGWVSKLIKRLVWINVEIRRKRESITGHASPHVLLLAQNIKKDSTCNPIEYMQ